MGFDHKYSIIGEWSKMANKQSNGQTHFKLPIASLSIKDLISIVSLAVTIATAWALFGARLTSLEKEVLMQREMLIKQEAVNTFMDNKLRSLELTQRDNVIYIDQLYEYLSKPLPRRHIYNMNIYTDPDGKIKSEIPSILAKEDKK